MLQKLLKSESGATAIEYGLIAALVAVVALPAMGSVGNELKTQFSMVGGTISGEAVAGAATGSTASNGLGNGDGANGNGLGNGNDGGNNGNGLGNGGAN